MNVASIIYRLLKCQVFSSKYLVLGIVLFFGACGPNEEFKPNFPVIISDKYLNKGQLIEPKDLYYNDFKILYIGERKDTINNIYPFGLEIERLELPGREKKIKKQRDYVMDLKSYDIYKNQTTNFTIEVDTNQLLSLMNFKLNGDYPLGQFYPVLVTNNSLTDSLFFPIYRGHSISLTVNHNNTNYSIGSFIGCGTHSECVYLPPQKIMISAVQKTKGSNQIKSVVQFGKIKSNEFYLNINPEIFETKELPSF